MSQKDTNWEGAWRVPCFMRRPGKIEPGIVLNGVVSYQDMLPTLLAIAGDPDVSEELLNGYKVRDKSFRIHIDGLNLVPYLRISTPTFTGSGSFTMCLTSTWPRRSCRSSRCDDFVTYPPRQKAASFNLDRVMAQLKPAMEAEKAKEAGEKRAA